MSLESLHKIIRLEEELLATEQGEQEKADIWVQKQLDSIIKKHADEISFLNNQIEEDKKSAAEEASRRAKDIILAAEEKAVQLKCIDDDALRQILLKNLNIIVGKMT